MDMLKRGFLEKRRVPRVAQVALLSVLCTGMPLGTALAEQMDGATRSATDDPAGQIGETLPATKHQAGVIEGEETSGHTKPQAGQMEDTGIPATKHQAQVLGEFGRLDNDRDGRLTDADWERYREYSRSVGSTDSDRQPRTLGDLKQVDMNGDGYVNYAEVYSAEHPDEQRPSNNPSALTEMFENASFAGLDKNGDNQVSLSEARLGSMLDIDDRAAYDYFDNDKDGDGNLSDHEFGEFQSELRRRISPDSASQP